MIYSDASRSGYGFFHDFDWQAGYFNSNLVPADYNRCDLNHRHWQNVNIPNRFRDNINVLEAVPILLMCKRYGPSWENRRILVLSDNNSLGE